MGMPVSRIGDLNTGHAPFPPVPLIGGSSNVMANGIPVGRIGDSFAVHCAPYAGCHVDMVTGGSSTVIVNGIPVGRIGDATGPATVMLGSTNVIIGG